MADTDDSCAERPLLVLQPLPADVTPEELAAERLARMRACAGAHVPASRCDNTETALVGTKVELLPYRPQHVPQMHQWFMDDEDLADTMCGCTTLPQEYRQQLKWQESTEHISFLISSRGDFGQVIGDVHLLFEKDEPAEDGEEEESAPPAIPPAADDPDAADIGEAAAAVEAALAAAPQNLDDWSREDVLGPRADAFFHEAEILVMVADPAFRRGGFATEAVVRLMQYGASVLGARRFIAKIDDANEASLALFTKALGFRVYARNEDFEMTHVELSGRRLARTLFDAAAPGSLCARFGACSARHHALGDAGSGDEDGAAVEFMTQRQLDNAKAALDHINAFKFKLPHRAGGGSTEEVEVQPSRFFAEPVDLEYFEGYTDIVKRPMDLGTVAENLGKDLYASPAAFRRDVQTTFANLLAFNNDPLETRRQFPDPRAAAVRLLDEFQVCYADYDFQSPAAAAGPSNGSPGSAEAAAAAATGASVSGGMDLEAKRRCRKQLDVLLLHRTTPAQARGVVPGSNRGKQKSNDSGKVRTCGPFVVPVLSLGLPDYEAAVAQPMDLCHVSNTLNADGYASPAAFAADVELTFRNALAFGGAIAYEDPDTEVQCLVPALARVALDTWHTLVK